MNCGMCWLACRPSSMSVLADDGLIDRVVDEALRGGDVVGAAGPQRRERRQAVADPAVLAGDVRVPHAIELRLRQRRQPAVHPVADLRGDVERLRVARVPMRVEQPREDLVQRVVRRPDAGVAAVRRELLEPDELRLRIRRQESRMPSPVGRRDDAAVTIAAGRVGRLPVRRFRRSGTTRRCRRRSYRRATPSATALQLGIERAIEDVELVHRRIQNTTRCAAETGRVRSSCPSCGPDRAARSSSPGSCPRPAPLTYSVPTLPRRVTARCVHWPVGDRLPSRRSAVRRLRRSS